MSYREQQLRAGALECIKALSALEQSAESLPNNSDDAAVFFSVQSGDAKALSNTFGPLTQRQEGAMRAMAEYIHCVATTGTPNLAAWRPIVSMTSDEQASFIGRMNEVERSNGSGAIT